MDFSLHFHPSFFHVTAAFRKFRYHGSQTWTEEAHSNNATAIMLCLKQKFKSMEKSLQNDDAVNSADDKKKTELF